MKREEVIRLFPERIRKILQQAYWNPQGLQEIRLRAGKPLILWQDGQEYFVAEQGFLTRHREQACIVSQEDIRRTMETVGTYSLYAYEEELKQGFLTIQGGHRVGVAGKAIMEEQKVKGLSQISCINIRFAHQITGCADMVIPYVTEDGKTFPGNTVGVVDERSEIGGSYQGIPQNDVGIRTDVLDCCSKAEGMVMLLRSMAPQVIAVDEIGNYEDIRAIEMTLNSGCKLLATVHGSSIDEIRKKPLLERLIKEHVFERYIILQKKRQERSEKSGKSMMNGEPACTRGRDLCVEGQRCSAGIFRRLGHGKLEKQTVSAADQRLADITVDHQLPDR